MALNQVVIPKRYKNGRPLFEQNLDAIRNACIDLFNDTQNNLTQLRKDLFLSNYDYNNNGTAVLSSSLQQQINLLSNGGTPISGTTSLTFSINSASSALTLTAVGLTSPRTVTFPDADGTVVFRDLTQTLTNKTLTSPV